jgi:GST-like protein
MVLTMGEVMAQNYVVYGAAGTGSVIIEAALTLLGAPYQVIEVGRAGAEADLARANPMRQVPAVIPPGGGLMTESAAILIWLADPESAPRPVLG